MAWLDDVPLMMCVVLALTLIVGGSLIFDRVYRGRSAPARDEAPADRTLVLVHGGGALRGGVGGPASHHGEGGADLSAHAEDDDAEDGLPAWSPDGSRIAYVVANAGDLDVYVMDADGSNVKRLTDTPGYDGGAFFSPDCSKIVWRASRPSPGEELEDYLSSDYARATLELRCKWTNSTRIAAMTEEMDAYLAANPLEAAGAIWHEIQSLR